MHDSKSMTERKGNLNNKVNMAYFLITVSQKPSIVKQISKLFKREAILS